MNTKFSLLLVIMVLNCSPLASEKMEHQARDFKVEVLEKISTTPSALSTSDNVMANQSDKENAEKETSNQAEEDGKSHDIHFCRLQRRRYNAVWIFAAKAFMLITYLCSVVTITLHVIHP